MQCKIVSAFQLVGADGPIELGGSKRRALVAYLLAHHGRPRSLDRIVDASSPDWGGSLSALAMTPGAEVPPYEADWLDTMVATELPAPSIVTARNLALRDPRDLPGMLDCLETLVILAWCLT